MPYGIPNEKKEQTTWMEKCVDSVMGQNKGYDKSRAIAICKAQLKKNGWKVKKSESGDDDVSIDLDVESEREIVTKIPNVTSDRRYRRITWGKNTI